MEFDDDDISGIGTEGKDALSHKFSKQALIFQINCFYQ
jgi:hypothetical protein